MESYRFGMDYPFEELFPDTAAFAGVKALSWEMTHRYLCFGADGASPAVARASKAPWVIGIGVSKAPDPKHRGRVLNVMRLTTSLQETHRFASSEEEKVLYGQWPQSVAVTDVFEVVGRPRVLEDLGMKVNPLLQAHDKVAALNDDRLPIVDALRGWKLRLADLPPLPAGVTLGKVVPGSISAVEGATIMRTVVEYERKAALAKAAKVSNRDANGGIHVCEGCGFRDAHVGLFDAHHRRPVHLGIQETTPAMLSVLCPTCHRVVHRLGEASHMPLDIPELHDWYAARTVAPPEKAPA